jgi:UDP-2,3-diacylglucosamine pyrophosphatase LpxH
MKEVYVFGDIEMGAGNLTDDFISDRVLAKLVLSFAKRPHPVDLILNGDTFDFLKAPYKLHPRATYTRYVTEKVSLAKLTLVHKAHKKVFDALKVFASKKDKHIYFIIGNHDLDLIFKKVQKKIRALLGNPQNIHFPGYSYYKYNVYVEHGQQYDIAHSVKLGKTFTHFKRKRILKYPFVSTAVIANMLPLKEEHPFFERLERVDAVPTLFSLHKIINKKVRQSVIRYFFKSVLYYPLRYIADPTYTLPAGSFREFVGRIWYRDWDVSDIIPSFKRKKRKFEIAVLGHIHHKYVEEDRGRVILRPGTWRDEYNLDGKSFTLTARTKRYVKITLRGKKLSWELIVVPIKRNVLDFYDVLKKEHEYRLLVAKEEGYVYN